MHWLQAAYYHEGDKLGLTMQSEFIFYTMPLALDVLSSKLCHLQSDKEIVGTLLGFDKFVNMVLQEVTTL